MTGNKKQTKIIQAAAGFSLVEIIISVALFSIIILSATEIFRLVIDSQQNTLATQNVQESLKYFLEISGKEMRMAQKNRGVCTAAGFPDSDNIFKVGIDASNSNTLSFKNYYGQCVIYYLELDGTTRRFRISRNNVSDYITPAKINLDNLYFFLTDNTSTQPIVTINLKAHALDEAQSKSVMTLQTSITSRFYKN